MLIQLTKEEYSTLEKTGVIKFLKDYPGPEFQVDSKSQKAYISPVLSVIALSILDINGISPAAMLNELTDKIAKSVKIRPAGAEELGDTTGGFETITDEADKVA